MQHLLTVHAIGNEQPLRETIKPATKPRLAFLIAGVVALVAASLAAIADQSDKFVSAHEIVGLHEIPSFVANRVELTPGLAVDSLVEDAGPSATARSAPVDPPTEDRFGQR